MIIVYFQFMIIRFTYHVKFTRVIKIFVIFSFTSTEKIQYGNSCYILRERRVLICYIQMVPGASI